MKLALATVAVAAILTPAASAQFYVDGGYNFVGIDVEDSGDSFDVDLGAIGGHAGFDFNPNFGVELEGFFGVADEEASAEGITASIELNYLIGAYGKAQVAVGENAQLFGRIGVVDAELELSASGSEFSGSESASESGIAYGVGGIFNISENLFVRGDYTRYDIEELEGDSFQIGLGFRF